MKKFICFILTLCVFLPLFSACAKKEAEYTLSVGSALSESLSDPSVSVTSAAVVTDKDGRIVLCRLDCAELDIKVEGGKVKALKAEKTKFEQGDGYGMKENGNALAEWYRQAEYFEGFAVGKTLEQIGGVKTGAAELTGGCTIDVSDFVKAISAAMGSEHKVSFTAGKELACGVSVSASVSGSADAEIVADIGAVTLFDNKVVAAVSDCAEAKMTLSEGKGSSFVFEGTKLELGDRYGMKEYGGAQWEWYEQSRSYSDTALGKTFNELNSLPTENVSGCTINADPLKAAIIRAGRNAR